MGADKGAPRSSGPYGGRSDAVRETECGGMKAAAMV